MHHTGIHAASRVCDSPHAGRQVTDCLDPELPISLGVNCRFNTNFTFPGDYFGELVSQSSRVVRSSALSDSRCHPSVLRPACALQSGILL